MELFDLCKSAHIFENRTLGKSDVVTEQVLLSLDTHFIIENDTWSVWNAVINTMATGINMKCFVK